MTSLISPHPVVAVLGSANMDLAVPVPHLPRLGETLIGGEMALNPGGKGANQAVAAQRATPPGGTCRFIGRIGDDPFGNRMHAFLTEEAVDTAALLVTPGVPTGTAVVLRDSDGDNAIVVSPGANARVTAADVHAARDAIATASVFAVQLEIPFDAVEAGLVLARRAGVLSILDPAPAPQPAGEEALATLPEALWLVDIFTPNQTEAWLFTGIEITDLASARVAGEALLRRGPKTVVLKLGALGAAIVTRRGDEPVEFIHIPAATVPVVDTTAAGDSFTGALATFLAEGFSIARAVRLAGIAGSLACTKAGALASIPSRQEILTFERAHSS